MSTLKSLLSALVLTTFAPLAALHAQNNYATPYTFTTLAGLAATGSADGVGTAAQFNKPLAAAVDAAGNIYIADSGNLIRKITPAGVVTTLAGGANGSADGTGRAAQFANPQGVAVDGTGNVFVADTNNHTIRKITPAGVVTTFAGSAGQRGSADGTGGAARFYAPSGVAVDGAGTVYVADTTNDIIRKVTPSGVVTTIAGSVGVSGTSDGIAGAAQFQNPNAVAVDSLGNVYVADTGNHTIRKITPAGVVTTFAGAGAQQGSADGVGSAARFARPSGIAVDSSDNLYVAEALNHAIRKITPTATVTTLAGVGGISGDAADGTGSAARFSSPSGLAVDGTGNVYVADTNNHVIRKITPAAVTTVFAGIVGSAGATNGQGRTARFNSPHGVALDGVGNAYVADHFNNTIRKITPTGDVSTFAGSAGSYGSTDGAGSAATFGGPAGVAVDKIGNVYVADAGSSTIRKITSSGQVSTFAGSPGNRGSDDGTGSAARFLFPGGLAVDDSGYLYVADSGNNRIRKITPDGVVTTFAGSTYGSSDGTGSGAQFNSPSSVAVDRAGNVYVADGNYEIRKITPTGVVTTLAGAIYYSGSADGTGSAARFDYPRGVAADASGNVYVTDSGAIRKITPAGVVTTLAGVPYSFGSADGIGDHAHFYGVGGIALDASGTLYVADGGNNTIRKGTPAVPTIAWDSPASISYGTALSAIQLNATSTVAGTFTYSPAVGTILDAGVDQPLSVTFTPNDSTNYLSATVTTKITVLKAVAAMMLDGLTQTYTGTPHPVTSATVTPVGLAVSTTYNGSTTVPTNVGNYLVIATVNDANYQGSVTVTLVIAHASLVAKADDKSKLVGAENPVLTISYTGFVNGEDKTVLNEPAISTTATTASPAGSYPITLSGGSAANYALILSYGTLTINTLAIAPEITSAASATFTVGQVGSFSVTATGTPTPTFSASGLPSWASLDSAIGTLSGTPPSTAGSPLTFTVVARNGTAPDASQNFTLTVQASTTAPAFTTQPSTQTVATGGNGSFSVAATGSPAPTYQWQLNSGGGANWADLANGGFYVGATTTSLSVTGVTPAMSGYRYRCIATNGVGSVSSDAVALTVTATNSFAGTYFGTFPNNRGHWAMKVNNDNSAVYIAYLNSHGSAVIVHLTLNPDGTFTTTATEIGPLTVGQLTGALSVNSSLRPHAAATAGAFTLSGQITAGGVTGQLTGLDETFSGTIDSTPGSAPSGFYTATALNTATGSTYAIVAPSGQTLVIVTSSTIDSASGTLGSNGQLATTTSSGAQLALSVNAFAQSIAATFTPAGSIAPTAFAGLADSVSSTSRLVNIATRASCATGDNVTIGGFVVSGSASKRVLIRAVGPTLTAQGLSPAEVLADPMIEVHAVAQNNAIIASNDNWSSNANSAEITSTAATIGASALIASDTSSAALLTDLSPGVYTFIVKGKNDSSGIVLLEVYDADAAAPAATFTNIATRAYATTNNGVAIGGFVISGNAPKRVLLRAVGPTLATLGLTAAQVLQNPVIELHDAVHNNDKIATNDNWAANDNAAAITTTAARIGATPFAGSDTASSALLITLNPGVYSFIAQGQGGSAGIVLVEVYDAD